MKKRILALLLAGVMTAASLVACKSEKTNENDTTSTTGISTETPTEKPTEAPQIPPVDPNGAS
ncbi:MAG: hypothetical protein IJX19_07415, partial [Clostridia bacterium]|nr:hypothetical protein [Clostridia bacterium]